MATYRKSKSDYIPEGIHECTVVTAKRQQNSKKTGFNLVLTLDIEINRQQRQVIYYVPEHISWRIDNAIECLDPDERGFDTDELPGRKCRVEVKDDEFRGETRTAVEKLHKSLAHNARASNQEQGAMWKGEDNDNPFA